jgi:hypothetical protein
VKIIWYWNDTQFLLEINSIWIGERMSKMKLEKSPKKPQIFMSESSLNFLFHHRTAN